MLLLINERLRTLQVMKVNAIQFEFPQIVTAPEAIMGWQYAEVFNRTQEMRITVFAKRSLLDSLQGHSTSGQFLGSSFEQLPDAWANDICEIKQRRALP